jgi:hypothetical protein
MNLHLAEIATQIAPGAHAALLVDRSGWHLSGRRVVPPNITLIPLQTKCPELNPQQSVWQFLRDEALKPNIFKSYGDVVDHCCEAWKNLVDQPWRIMSVGIRVGPMGPDQRASASIFGAICPKDGKGAALVVPRCNTEAITSISPKSPPRSRREHEPCCWSIRPAAICPAD